jgi:hypothetical protein
MQVVPEEVGVWVDGGVALRARRDVNEVTVDGWTDDGVEEGVGIELKDVEGLAGVRWGDGGETCGECLVEASGCLGCGGGGGW